jgi:cytochrome c biogenesis protein CcmG/thiol:disulfide interchange protein DsbE
MSLDASDLVEEGEDEPRGGRAKGTVVAVAIVVIVAWVAWIAMSALGGGALGQDPFGRAAPDFVRPMLNGEGQIALSDFRGRPVVLNFWASWCGPCKEEAPILAATEKLWRDRGVVFLGVDSLDKRPDAIAFEERYGIEYQSAFDESGEIADTYGVLGYPETFFIDADGVIVAKYVGPMGQEDLNTYLAQITS